MKTSRKASIAIIGGSGLESLTKATQPVRVGTPHGIPSAIQIEEISGKRVAFLARHGSSHKIPPHKVNYRANIFALRELGVRRIFATNAVGGISRRLEPGNLVVPHDFIDFTRLRRVTFYDEAPVTHIDMSQPYCPEIRNALIEAAESVGQKVINMSVLGCTEGPRYETPAEISMLRSMGCDIVGMTGVPEVILARELEMCYASLCYVSNKAAGLQEHQTVHEIAEIAEKKKSAIKQVLKEAIVSLPEKRNCRCAHTLKDARI